MLQPAFVVPEKRGGFLIHGAQLGVREVRNTSIHGEGTQVYVNGDMRTADEIAYVVDALRPHSLHRAQSGAIGLMIEPGVEVLAGIDPVGTVRIDQVQGLLVPTRRAGSRTHAPRSPRAVRWTGAPHRSELPRTNAVARPSSKVQRLVSCGVCCVVQASSANGRPAFRTPASPRPCHTLQLLSDSFGL